MPAKKKPATKPAVLLRARETFFVGRITVYEGDIVDSKDTIVKGREHLFAPVGVEQATAAPGELRNVTTKPKKEN